MSGSTIVLFTRFGLTDKVQVGIVGGMPAILEALAQAEKVVSV